jgi:DNA segregation ATPase FtsK/SpoIIIE-like protein
MSLITVKFISLNLINTLYKHKVFISIISFISTGIIVLLLTFFYSEISSFIINLKDNIIIKTGASLINITISSIAIFFLLNSSFPNLKKARLTLSVILILFFTIGLMAFYSPYNGILSSLTLQGRTTLGGDFGKFIIGSQNLLGIIRLLVLLLISITLISPENTQKFLNLLIKSAIFIYINLLIFIQKFYASKTKDKLNIPKENLNNTIAQDYTLDIKPETLNDKTDLKDINKINPIHKNTNEIGSTTIYSENNDYETELNINPNPIINHENSNIKFNKLWEPKNEEKIITTEKEIHNKIMNPSQIKNSTWALPSINTLKESVEEPMKKEDLDKTASTIKTTLDEYGVEVEIGQIKPGPTVTMYGLIPGWIRKFKQTKKMTPEGKPQLDESGKPIMIKVENKTRVKVDHILSREKDLALALKTPSIRLENPVMGEAQVGIEVPNSKPSIVTLRSLIESNEFKSLKKDAALPVALGKDSSGETIVIDLTKMPHLLIAGATGSGKSVCINTIVSGLITQKSPAEIRLLLIDPKRVELTPYNGIPHLLTKVVVETDAVVGFLKGTIREMLDRYRLLEESGVRNIEAYNKKTKSQMPYLLVVVDELADLMMSAAFDVEQSICRLAQLGRATGIHLIVATQRPSVDVVTGLIKANFPSRISFGVTAQVDSRTILDTGGAEKLLGKGDMLYLPINASKPSRIQGVFISDNEVEKIVSFWETTPWSNIPQIDILTPSNEAVATNSTTNSSNDSDELVDKAIELAKNYNKLSTSLLQRRLRIGYPRAARLIDELEEQGIIGPGDGPKSRDVLI